MMEKPTVEELTAMARLQTFSEFQVFNGWLTRALLVVDQQNRNTRTSPEREWGQGQAQTLSEITKTVETAGEALRQARGHNQKPGTPLV